MTRLLYFSRDYTPHDHRFLTALAETNYEVGYLRLERRGVDTEDRVLPPEIQWIPWVGGAQPATWRNALSLYLSLKKVIRDFKPNVVLAGPIQRAGLLTALTGFHPLITMSWGYDLLIDAERDPLWRWATQFTLKSSDVLVGDCQTIRNRAIKYGMAADRIVTFPWGADIQRYTPGDDGGLRKRWGWGEEHFVILSTRGWAPIYGTLELVKAFTQVAQDHPAMRLLMLGNGPQAPEIHKILAGARLIDRVQFAGQVPQERLPMYYRAADLYVSASYSDGTSISLLEAFASGLPVLVSDIPGNREWVTPDVGWLFPMGDVDALADALTKAYQERSQFDSMRQNARKLAEARADWRKNFPKLIDAIEMALS